MQAFDRETDVDRLDFQLLMLSPVRLVHSRSLLGDTVDWLRRHGYEILEVDASWLITSHMFRDLGSALGHICHDQWHCLGESFDEALAEVWSRASGFALVFTGFDVFAAHQRDDAHIMLELVAERAWRAALLGRRLLCLVQSDSTALELRRIGMWTPAWFGSR
ncbi:hypothetical protein [Nocardia sp. NPDC050406]|uniref:hypothetical protein n=1 Tax=Nocardia sp. NPDC050406 TaxID=3364318 RepID=UPI0037878B60